MMWRSNWLSCSRLPWFVVKDGLEYKKITNILKLLQHSDQDHPAVSKDTFDSEQAPPWSAKEVEFLFSGLHPKVAFETQNALLHRLKRWGGGCQNQGSGLSWPRRVVERRGCILTERMCVMHSLGAHAAISRDVMKIECTVCVSWNICEDFVSYTYLWCLEDAIYSVVVKV